MILQNMDYKFFQFKLSRNRKLDIRSYSYLDFIMTDKKVGLFKALANALDDIYGMGDAFKESLK